MQQVAPDSGDDDGEGSAALGVFVTTLADHWLPVLGPAELRVVLWVARQTLGRGRTVLHVREAHMLTGVPDRGRGGWSCPGTRLSRATLYRALATLSTVGLLSYNREDRGGYRGGWRMELHPHALPPATIKAADTSFSMRPTRETEPKKTPPAGAHPRRAVPLPVSAPPASSPCGPL